MTVDRDRAPGTMIPARTGSTPRRPSSRLFRDPVRLDGACGGPVRLCPGGAALPRLAPVDAER